MNPTQRRAARFAVLLLLLAGQALLPLAVAGEPEDRFRSSLEARVPALLAEYGVPGTTVASIRDGAADAGPIGKPAPQARRHSSNLGR